MHVKSHTKHVGDPHRSFPFVLGIFCASETKHKTHKTVFTEKLIKRYFAAKVKPRQFKHQVYKLCIDKVR